MVFLGLVRVLLRAFLGFFAVVALRLQVDFSTAKQNALFNGRNVTPIVSNGLLFSIFD